MIEFTPSLSLPVPFPRGSVPKHNTRKECVSVFSVFLVFLGLHVKGHMLRDGSAQALEEVLIRTTSEVKRKKNCVN